MLNHFTRFLLLILLIALASIAARAQAQRPPNILIFLADDMGYSDPGCFGGEIATPNIDRLASQGLRFTQFYNTARCWPTRACILTGYYAQQVRMDPPNPKAGLPKWTRVVPHYLKPLGYRCYHSGKWHLINAPRSISQGGFDHSYRIEDHDHNFYPSRHFEDDQPLPPVQRGSTYYTTTAIADHAIRCLKEHAQKFPDHPFFQYVAFTVPHFPLQAPPRDIDRYRDRYLAGWEAIRQQRYERLKSLGIARSPLPPPEPARAESSQREEDLIAKLGPGEVTRPLPWGSLTDEQRNFQATKMAIHAAMVDRMDQEIGRVLAQLDAMGAADNTVVFFLSDNGASAEQLVRGDGHDRSAPPGSGASYLCLGPGWSTVCNTPHRLHKIWVHEGGISTPLVVRWPAGIKARGELRQDPGHVIDLLPTILDLTGAKPDPSWNGAQPPPLPGRSLTPAFSRDGALQRPYLYFDHSNNRALRVGDWKIVSAHNYADRWALYDLSRDRGETHNLAAQEPQRLQAMIDQWTQAQQQFRTDASTP